MSVAPDAFPRLVPRSKDSDEGFWARWVRFARETPSAVLLVVQLLGVLLYGVLAESDGERSVAVRTGLSIFGIVVLFLAVRAVRETPALTWIAALLGLPIVVLTVWTSIDEDNRTVALTSDLVHAAFYLYTGYALIRYMFNDDWVTRDELWATGAAFTVIAWGFAYIYSVVQILWPTSFNAYQNPTDPRTWFELLFLSFTTLTSTGLSDIGPVRDVARSWVMIEQVTGMLYVALVVSRLVGLTLTRFRAEPSRARPAPSASGAGDAGGAVEPGEGGQ